MSPQSVSHFAIQPCEVASTGSRLIYVNQVVTREVTLVAVSRALLLCRIRSNVRKRPAPFLRPGVPMSDVTATAVGQEIDLASFHGVFFEEAFENLASLEQSLLDAQFDSLDQQQLNAIFRAAHSVKGGAATFGFNEITAVAHELKTLLDRVRCGELALSRPMVDVFLRATDVTRDMLHQRQSGTTMVIDDAPIMQELRQLTTGAPLTPPFQHFSDSAEGDSKSAASLSSEMPDRSSAVAIAEGSFGLFDDSAGAPSAPGSASSGRSASSASPKPRPLDRTVDAAGQNVKPASQDAQTLRVAVDKVDQLLNLVGELVITQAMLTQRVQRLDPGKHQGFVSGIGDLERSTRNLQEAVMSIRMIPMSFVFNRYPRMVRDLASKLGKQVQLVTNGEATELDKGLVEKITDPLNHLIRNAIDHGIESPDLRIASGKPALGTIRLSASHQGGSIVIEVGDDGAGLDRDRILAKARERGLDLPSAMSDADVWQLIFAPGFSTADAVTEVSGRGVGMDVVKRNIASLGGSVDLLSEPGHGSRIIVRLPLTLAIMDGMSVDVGGETYILPLASVVESLPADRERIAQIADAGHVVKIRDEFLPVLSLASMFKVPAKHHIGTRILVVVESELIRTAVLVDELVAQHQVVVKNLESHYRKVPGASGATILGDGRVALILDVAELAREARRHRATIDLTEAAPALPLAIVAPVGCVAPLPRAEADRVQPPEPPADPAPEDRRVAVERPAISTGLAVKPDKSTVVLKHTPVATKSRVLPTITCQTRLCKPAKTPAFTSPSVRTATAKLSVAPRARSGIADSDDWEEF